MQEVPVGLTSILGPQILAASQMHSCGVVVLQTVSVLTGVFKIAHIEPFNLWWGEMLIFQFLVGLH